MSLPNHLLIIEESVETSFSILEALHFVKETADTSELESLKGSLLTLLTQTQRQLSQARRSIRILNGHDWTLNPHDSDGGKNQLCDKKEQKVSHETVRLSFLVSQTSHVHGLFYLTICERPET